MPAIVVGIREVEVRLSLIRRRLNLLALQHEIYLKGSAVILAISLLIWVALRGDPSMFRLALWTAIGVATVSVVLAVVNLRRRWVSLDRVARLADRKAGLEDRISTLVAHLSTRAPSQLRGLLLTQILALRPRWDVRLLAPRRVPRSSYLFLASLLTLAATSWIEHRSDLPAATDAPAPINTAATESGTLFASAPETAGGQKEVNHGAGLGLTTASKGMGTKESRAQEQTGHETPSSVPGADKSVAAQAHLGHSGLGALAGVDGRGLTGHPMDEQAIPDRLQDAIQQTFGTKPLPDSDRASAAAQQPAVKSSQHRTQSSPQAGHGDKGKTGDRPSKQLRGPEQRVDSKVSSRPGTKGGHSVPAGDSNGDDSNSLFAARPADNGKSPQPKTFTLKLTAFSASAPTHLEPQQPRNPTGTTELNSIEDPESPPSSQERPDDPLRKVDVSPEHESILRQIFTPRD